ncbi:MAG: response regulator [Myxococcaceae bacterium]
MPTHVLIVDGETSLSARVRAALQQRGHTVEETADGRSVLERVRQRPPGVVVLAVELPSGQNGYLLVGKLKKDEVLKSIPVILVGNPEGFDAHRRLKNRADEYLPRPLDIPTLVSAVARLSGAHEETPLVLEEEATVAGDPDLDLIDAAFDDAPGPPPPPSPARPARAAATPAPPPAAAPPRHAPAPGAEEDFSELTADDGGPTMVQAALAPADLEVVSDDDAQARAFAAEVQAAAAELVEEPAGESGGDGSADAVLRVRSELHAAEQLTSDLRDQHAQAEQRELELKAELGRRDGQLKALQTRLDQALQERRRLEQALQAGGDGDEARRALEEELVAARRDVELNRAHAEGAERQLQALHERAETAESELMLLREQPRNENASEELEALRARVAELEDETVKKRERVTRLYARLKAEERAREKARKAVAVAGQLLAEQSTTPLEPVGAPLEPVGGEPDPGSSDEPAVA